MAVYSVAAYERVLYSFLCCWEISLSICGANRVIMTIQIFLTNNIYDIRKSYQNIETYGIKDQGQMCPILWGSSSRRSCYPRATRCGGDIVTLLWFRPCARVCVCPSCFNLVNTIETEPLHASSSNLADMFTMTRG